MVCTDTAEATSYALENLQIRGTLFVSPMYRCYEGMIVGENCRPEDMPCNPTKRKQLTNHRSSIKEIDTGLKIPRKFTLESALEWIAEDELVEVTPENIRVRKTLLTADARKRADRRAVALAG